MLTKGAGIPIAEKVIFMNNFLLLNDNANCKFVFPMFLNKHNNQSGRKPKNEKSFCFPPDLFSVSIKYQYSILSTFKRQSRKAR